MKLRQASIAMLLAAYLASEGASVNASAAAEAVVRVANLVSGQPLSVDGPEAPFEVLTWGPRHTLVAAVISVLVDAGHAVMGGALRDQVAAAQGHPGSLAKDVDCYLISGGPSADSDEDPGNK